MASTVLEQMRLLHEEIEALEAEISDTLESKPRQVRAALSPAVAASLHNAQHDTLR